ncbi:MAG: AraC family transcriptional regulator [Alicyclobacillus sp.]|nr:AraC family transcriptional regulator [Alicyclobacillus sp.]
MADDALRENRNHGDAWFPLSVYHVVLTPGPTQQTVSHHWHDEAEFVLVTKGSVAIQVGFQFYTVEAGQGVMVHPGEVHSMEAPTGCTESECYAIVFNLHLLYSEQCDRIQHRFLNPLAERSVLMPTLLFNAATWERDVLKRFGDIIRLYTERPPGYELAVKGTLYLILYTLTANHQLALGSTQGSLDDQQHIKFKNVITYISGHYAEKIRLRDLAAVANMSEGHFCRYFKQMTNKKPIQYINEYRINCAANLLSATNKSVMDIALDVGFDNLSYFIKVFRSLKQCTPSEYRHMLRHAQLESDVGTEAGA